MKIASKTESFRTIDIVVHRPEFLFLKTKISVKGSKPLFSGRGGEGRKRIQIILPGQFQQLKSLEDSLHIPTQGDLGQTYCNKIKNK
jgi:hypothetical protein